jgi:hypothetical protein
VKQAKDWLRELFDANGVPKYKNLEDLSYRIEMGQAKAQWVQVFWILAALVAIFGGGLLVIVFCAAHNL